MSGILIAGTNSGSGKTTVSIGMMAALKKRGLNVLPYKVGPDYIDPGFHRFVTGNPSYNLDGYMLDDDALNYIYHSTERQADDVKIIEGVMGLYDGFGTIYTVGSSADIAKKLDVPVILVIDGSGVSTSSAATVLGFIQYDQAVNIAGVIVNKVSGDMHYQMIKKAIEYHTGIFCLGYLKKNSEVSLNSRHLGLIPVDEVACLRDKVSVLAEMVEETIELDEIVRFATTAKTKSQFKSEKIEAFIKENKPYFDGKKIGVAYSNAFSFYYQSNFDLLESLGAKLVMIDPEKAKEVPDNIEAMYIGGGFPEVFAEHLSENKPFMQDLKQKLENGLTCYAECGGLMYLTKSITTLEDQTYEMVGFVDANSTMTKRLQRFGYINVNFDGLEMKCHEFHRSKLLKDEKLDYQYNIRKYRDGQCLKSYECGAKVKNTICGYPHVHFLSNLEFIKKVF